MLCNVGSIISSLLCVIAITSLFTNLPWPGDSEGIFWFTIQLLLAPLPLAHLSTTHAKSGLSDTLRNKQAQCIRKVGLFLPLENYVSASLKDKVQST